MVARNVYRLSGPITGQVRRIANRTWLPQLNPEGDAGIVKRQNSRMAGNRDVGPERHLERSGAFRSCGENYGPEPDFLACLASLLRLGRDG